MSLENQDKILLFVSFITAIIGIVLIVIGFVLRFANGFANFFTFAQQDNDFLELRRLDMIFGLFIAAACVLVLSFFVMTYATLRKNIFLLKAYCAMIALMIVIQLVDGLLAFTYSDQINQLASDEIMYESLSKAAQLTIPSQTTTLPNNSEVLFWSNTQNSFGCCGVANSTDWTIFWREESKAQLELLNCFEKHYSDGCEKIIRNRISTDAQYLGAASMGVLVVEIIASFLAGYRAYTLSNPDFSN